MSRNSSRSLVAAALLLRANRRLGWGWAALTALVAVVIAANWLLSPVFRLRLQSDVDGEWYRATVVAPAELTLAAAETRPIEITLTNDGALTFNAQPDPEFVIPGVTIQLWKIVGMSETLSKTVLSSDVVGFAEMNQPDSAKACTSWK